MLRANWTAAKKHVQSKKEEFKVSCLKSPSLCSTIFFCSHGLNGELYITNTLILIFIQIELEKKALKITTLEQRVTELQEHLRMQSEITVLCLACTQQRMEQETEERGRRSISVDVRGSCFASKD